jgi:hypothetical protein
MLDGELLGSDDVDGDRCDVTLVLLGVGIGRVTDSFMSTHVNVSG